MRHTLVVLGAVAVFAGVQSSARATGPVQLSLEGVLGDAIHLGPPHQARTTIVYFMSRRAKDESSRFARAVDETLLNAPVEAIGIVDVRRYGGILRRIATSYLKRSADDALVSRRERRVAKGVDASPEFVNRWHLIGDFDGSLFARFGVESEPARPLAFVLDRDGGVHGPYAEASAVVAACTSLAPPAR